MSAAPAQRSSPDLDFISVSLVERLTSSTGTAFMIRARLRGANFRPAAIVHKRGERWVAEVLYREPIGPERESSLHVPLFIHPLEVR